MKKFNPIWVMIPVVVIVGFFAKQRFHRDPGTLRYDGNQIGHSLLEFQHSPLVIYISDTTKEKIVSITNLNPIVNIKNGDELKPIGDGEADFRIIYCDQNGNDLLGLRMKRTKEPKYEILGFWTPSK